MRFGPFLILGLLLLLAWVGGFVVYHSAGFLIHVLLILAVISVIVHFLRERVPQALKALHPDILNGTFRRRVRT
jgi:Family of unknown function (DUF5670)